jgi:hypothetical protein
MPHETVEPVGVRPIGLDRNDVEAMPLDQHATDRGAGAVEFGSPVRPLAQHHDESVAEALEWQGKIPGERSFQRFAPLPQGGGILVGLFEWDHVDGCWVGHGFAPNF